MFDIFVQFNLISNTWQELVTPIQKPLCHFGLNTMPLQIMQLTTEINSMSLYCDQMWKQRCYTIKQRQYSR